MKKNKMMRIASVLLVAVLISTCAISGTFAKYVTKVSGKDEARVAKWGILLELTAGEAFASEYEAHDEDYKAAYQEVNGSDAVALSVKAETPEEGDPDKLVAPGTSSADLDATIKGTVTGQAEVAVRYALMVGDFTDVVLPAGEYTDYTELVLYDKEEGDEGYDEDLVGTYGYYKTFTLEADYHPIKWDITVSKGSTSYTLSEIAAGYPAALAAVGATGVGGFSLEEIKTILSGQYKDALLGLLTSVVSGAYNPQVILNDDGELEGISLDFEPGKDMGFTFELTWSWPFEQVTPAEGATALTDDEAAQLAIFDAADTYLGNVAADALIDDDVQEFAEDDAEISIKISADLTASATQID